MYLKSKIGRVGTIVSMSHIAGESAIKNGTHEPATHEEIVNAGLMQQESTIVDPDKMPAGYLAVPCPAGFGGYEIFTEEEAVKDEKDETRKPIDENVYPNLIAARAGAHAHAKARVAAVKGSDEGDEDEADEGTQSRRKKRAAA